jgi:glutamate 5-kinase
MRAQIKNSKRIVIKIGTNVLADKKGFLEEESLKRLIEQIVAIRKEKDIVLVTSGAIGCGMAALGLKSRPRDVKLQQACAAVGQSVLMSIYNRHFSRYNTKTAQILLTYDAFSNRRTYLNLKNSMETLLRLGVIPIVNENDPISIDEIGPSFGDNDMLSALVASKIEADLLLVLTTVDGLYDKDPMRSRDAKLVKEVIQIDKKIERMGGKSKMLGIGGMSTKIEAAKIATSAGINFIIANGKKPNVIIDIVSGKEIGTLFYPKQRLSGKKRWIMQSKPKGKIFIDEGALNAIKSGKNLLPAGINEVAGNFSVNDVVEVHCGNKLCAKAVVDYSAEDLKKIKGKKSNEAGKILGSEVKNVTKRENLVFI